MHTNPHLTEQRARRTLAQRVLPAVYPSTHPLSLTSWTAPDEPVPFSHAVRQHYEPVRVGTTWGLPWRTTWLHATGTVPAQWRQAAGRVVELVVDLGFTGTQPGFQAEGLVRRHDGSALKAVSPLNRAVDWTREPDQVDVYIEAASNPDVAGGFDFAPTPYGYKETAGTAPLYTLRQVDIALRDTEVWELAQDLTVLLELAEVLPLDSVRRARVDLALERAVDRIDPLDVSGTAAAARAELAGVLASPAHASAHHVLAVGHAHIDSAWLWPVRETVRKCIRTFSSVLALMDQDPDLVFACSSAQQYAWVKEHDPGLYERIRQRVAEGRFVPVGGMWLEADTNMPGSEALARQMVEGKSFFLEELGVETQDVWLPDSFGYTGSLPGIMRAAGSRWFLSQKLSWNDTNTMPHHTFTWEGIDGSRVLTHFPPVDSYNSRLAVGELVHAETNFREKGVASSSIVPFGYGDGGGGPTREMLAAAHRLADLEGAPTVELGSPVAFFTRAEAELGWQACPPEATGQAGTAGAAEPERPGRLPVWSGEMYLEFHRGTYTSQLRTKQGNRRSEHLLREAELWAATAAVREGADYPYEVLKECWRTVLRNQFHDILPGTSIGWVYQRTEAEYRQVAAKLEAVVDQAAAALVGQGTRPLLLNAAPSSRRGVRPLAVGEPTSRRHGPTKDQPRRGLGEVSLSRQGRAVVVDNGLLRLEIDSRGLITSLRDLEAGREVLPDGQPAGLLQLHRDLPRQWDAWDIDPEYRNTVEDITGLDELAVSRQGEGGEDVVVRVTRRVGSASVVTQETRVSPGSRQVVLSLDIDWHEQQRLLKLAFPLDLKADCSTAEMQFGHVSRPTHQNTSWDAARYEICAHRWIHVGEEDYGVAVLNDSTYGHDVTRDTSPQGYPVTTVRLSLLRAPLFPDPQADQGRHRLRVALCPGATVGQAVTEGYAFNLPERTVRGDHAVEPLVAVTGTGVVVEAVKLAEDRSGDVVVRLYESRGARTRATVTAGFAATGATAVDLLERPAPQLEPERWEADRSSTPLTASFDLRPFQIVTVRLAR